MTLATPHRATGRPLLLLVALTALAVSACTGGGGDSGGDPITPPPPPTFDASKGAVGCYAAGFSGLDTSQLGCGLITSFGDFAFDQQFTQEIALQSSFWQNVPATVYAFDECSPDRKNAYALPSKAILMGYWMVQDLVFGTGSTLPVAGVLAHEWGHQIQFQFGWMNSSEPTVRRTELEADMWSGFYMALAKSWVGAQMNAYFQALFSLGDYYFHDPGHHGTPNQRLAAGAVGFDVGLQVGLTGQRLSYVELHNLFTSEINRIVSTIGAQQKLAVPDLSYAATVVAQGIDREFVAGVLAGEHDLTTKSGDLRHMAQIDRELLAPY